MLPILDRMTSTENAYTGDKVINTVLNINDSNTAEVLNNFNVSKDEILRRISALQPAFMNNISSTITERQQQQNQQHSNTDNDANSADTEKRE